MPGVIALHLDVPHDVEVYPARLHGAACALLEHGSTAHRGQDKPFAVWPLRPGPDGAAWRLGWLPDGVPALGAGDSVMFGAAVFPVLHRTVDLTSFARLASGGPVRSADLRLLSPTFFSRNGRDHPLPDPVLLVESAVRRWNVHAPPDAHIPEDLRRALRAAVYLADMVGETRRGRVSRTMEQLGFVGTVRLALTRSAGETVRCLFGALMRFVDVAGVGAQTTHGFGAVELLELGSGPA